MAQNEGSEAAAATAVQHKPLSKVIKVFYGVGDFGFTCMSNVETYYFVFFLTNFAMFDPATAALVSGVGSMVDAILGWMYGGFINSLKPMRWGRYRSWLLVLPWIVPFLYCMEFTTLSSNTMLSAVLIIIFNVTSHAAWDFPYVANISMISMAANTPEERAHMASTRAMYANASKIFFGYIMTGLLPIGASLLGQANQYAFGAFIMGAVMAILYFVHFKMFKGYEKEYTKEELKNFKKTNDQGRTTFRDLGRAVVTNPPLIFLLLADISKWVFNFMCAGIATYYFTYAVFNPGMLATYIFISNILSVAGAYLSAPFARLIRSTRNAMVVAFLFMGAMMMTAYFNYFDIWWVVIFMSLAQFAYGITYSCSTAMYADTVVYNEWKNNTNAAGWINGLQLFPLKIGFVFRGVLIPVILGMIGFTSAADFAPYLEAGATLSAEFISFQSGIGIGFMIFPSILVVVSALLLLLGFKLTPTKLKQYQAEIDERRAAEKAAAAETVEAVATVEDVEAAKAVEEEPGE